MNAPAQDEFARLVDALISAATAHPYRGESHAKEQEARARVLSAYQSARAQAEAGERDAARYRWLRQQSHPWGKAWYSLGALDNKIDEALARREREG